MRFSKHNKITMNEILTCQWREIFCHKAVKAPACNQVFVQVQLTLVFPTITLHSDRVRQRHIRQVRAMISLIGANALGFFSIVKNRQNKVWMRGHVHCTPEQGVVGSGEVKEQVVCQDDAHKQMTESLMAQAHCNVCVSQQILDMTPTIFFSSMQCLAK